MLHGNPSDPQPDSSYSLASEQKPLIRNILHEASEIKSIPESGYGSLIPA